MQLHFFLILASNTFSSLILFDYRSTGQAWLAEAWGDGAGLLYLYPQSNRTTQCTTVHLAQPNHWWCGGQETHRWVSEIVQSVISMWVICIPDDVCLYDTYPVYYGSIIIWIRVCKSNSLCKSYRYYIHVLSILMDVYYVLCFTNELCLQMVCI